jgi:hypothetical protein
MTSGAYSDGTVQYSPYGFNKTWNGVDGKYKTESGRLVYKDNPYIMSLVEQRATRSVYPGSSGDPPTYISSVPTPAFGLGWSNSLDLKLEGKLVSAVREHDFNLAVNVAQGVQTVNMVVDNLKKIGRSFWYLKKGDLPSAFRQLGTAQRGPLKTKDVPGRWLEMQYGWLPLVGDSYEAFKAYHALTSHARTLRIKVKQSGSSYENHSQSPAIWDGYGPCKCRKKIVHILREELSAPRSLGLQDPLSVIWEIIPYSFVVDWFLPIGSYLDNLSIIPKLNGEFVTTSSWKYMSFSVPKGNFDVVGFYAHARAQARRIGVSRAISSGLPVTLPTFVPFQRAMSAKRVYNAIALVSQVFLSGRSGVRGSKAQEFYSRPPLGLFSPS